MLKYLEEFTKYLTEQKNYSYHTIQNYYLDLKQFIYFLETNNKEFNKINNKTINEFIGFLRNKNLSIKSINRKIASLKSFYKWFIEYYQNIPDININKIQFIKDTQNNIPKTTDFKEIEEKIKKITNIKDRLILKILLYTGLRVSEVINIKLININLNKNLITIRGKGNKIRQVILHPEIINDLKYYLQEHSPKIYLFENKITQKNISARSIEKTVKKYFKELHPHIFRHTFATYYIEKGGSLRNIQELLGHSSLKTTQIYLNVTMDKIKHEYFNIMT